MTCRGVVLHFLAVGLLLCLCSPGVMAQGPQSGQPLLVQPAAVINFADLARQQAAAPGAAGHRVIPIMPAPTVRAVPPGVSAPSAGEATPSVPVVPLTPSPAPAVSFAAVGDNDTVIPPDTMGAAGPNHLMVTLNSEVRIMDRSGGTISSVSLDAFWSSTGATVIFDPKLTYDPFNARWIFSAASGVASPNSKLMLGVSQTSDPTGNWNLYTVRVDPTGRNWGDFPSLGFNHNWIVVSLNLFSISFGTFVQENIYVFNKADAYAGAAVTAKTFADTTGGFTGAPAVTYDDVLGTEYLVEDWYGNIGGSGYMRISTITGAVGSEVYTPGTAFAVVSTPWDDYVQGIVDFAPQLGSTHKINNGDARVINALYRNGSLWAAHNAYLPSGSPTHTVAQWWQMSPTGTVQQFGRVEDTTGATFYAYPSLSVNKNGDALLGYSTFSASQYASAGYSFRTSADPAGAMRSGVMLKAGEASYYKTFSGAANRWGDYSSTVVDPVNDTDFWTIQEYASSPNFANGDNRWGTWWAKVVPPAVTPAAVSVTPSSGNASSQTFSLLYSDPLGAADLGIVGVIINSTLSGANGCAVLYDRASNVAGLFNDTGTGFAGIGTLGTATTLQNAQCTVNLQTSSASSSGTDLTLNLALTFSGSFGGGKLVYMIAVSSGGPSSDWQVRGTWLVPSAPQAVSVTPSSGSGLIQNFALLYSDPLGAADLNAVAVLVNSSLSSAGGCYLMYIRTWNLLLLADDTGTAAAGSGILGTAMTLQNSQCSVNLLGSSALASANNLTLTLPLTFKTAFAGAKNVYMFALSNGGSSSGWQTKGTWTVPAQ